MKERAAVSSYTAGPLRKMYAHPREKDLVGTHEHCRCSFCLEGRHVVSGVNREKDLEVESHNQKS